MFTCTDPVVSYLGQFGFNVIRLPRAGLAPGIVLVGKGPQLEVLGPISEAWVSRRPAPQPTPPATAAILANRTTDAFDLTVGLSLAEQLLAVFGVSVPKLKVGFGNAHSLRFGFGDAKIWSVATLELGRFLGSGKLVDSNPAVTAFFGENSPPVHIVTDLLISSSLTVAVGKKSHASDDIDLGVLQSAVSCDVEVTAKNDESTVVSFKGKERLAFGFRAVKGQLQLGKWELHGFPKPGSVMFAAPVDPRTWAVLFPAGEASIT